MEAVFQKTECTTRFIWFCLELTKSYPNRQLDPISGLLDRVLGISQRIQAGNGKYLPEFHRKFMEYCCRDPCSQKYKEETIVYCQGFRLEDRKGNVCRSCNNFCSDKHYETYSHASMLQCYMPIEKTEKTISKYLMCLQLLINQGTHKSVYIYIFSYIYHPHKQFSFLYLFVCFLWRDLQS